jgi:hypothetical protein
MSSLRIRERRNSFPRQNWQVIGAPEADGSPPDFLRRKVEDDDFVDELLDGIAV